MRRLGSPLSFQALSFLGRVSARPPTPLIPWHVRFPPMTSEVAPTTRPPLTSLSDEESMFRDAIADFADHEVRPRVREMERAGRIDPTLIPQYFSLGLMGIEVPEQYGGAGGSLMMVALAVEAVSHVDASAAIMVDVQNTLVNYPILRYGNDDIKTRYLPRLTSESVGAYALSEPGSGSDAFGMQTTATRAGDHYVLNGRKMWITNGAEAEIFVLFANANREAGYKGITAFVVERGFPGFRGGKEGRQARHPGVEHRRAHAGWL